MVLDGEKYIVIGVMPRGFQFLESYVGLWVPLALGPDEVTSDAHYLAVVARLGHGVSLIRAQADLDTITRRTSLDAAAGTRPPNTYLVPLEDELVGHARRGLLVLLAAVASVLLIGCANLASLLLARAASRGREFAVRAALGAGRSRIVTQLLMESALLAVLGVAPALLVASATLAFLEPLVPAGVALSADPSIDLAALGFMAALAVLSVVVFGLAPALHITRLVSGPGLQQRGAGHGDVGTSRARSALVVGEVAITLLLLVGASLLIQTLYHLRYANLGLRPEGVLTLRTSLPFEKYGERARRVAFYDEVLERVSHLPGVLSAGYTTSVPLEWQGGTTGIVVEGHPRDPTVTYEANHRQVSAGYFQTIGVPLLNGRFFDGTDSEQSQRVAMVNQTMARQYWPGEDAVGRRFTIGKPASPSAWLTIVGIVGDVRQMGLEAPVKAEMYFPYHQVQGYQWFGPRDLVVRTSGGDPIGWAGAVAREVHAVDPDEAVANVRTLEAILDEHVAEPRLAAALLVAFAGLALVLASVGIYGMLSFFVAEHLPEIGVRVALGADKSDIVRLIVGKGLVLTLAGASFGAIGALAMTRVLSSQLYGVGEHDPLAFIGAAIAVLAVAVVASYFPARRAAGLDPVVALRAE